MKACARPKLLYIGPFRLPEGNAAAQRVLSNAKGLRDIGYDVFLAETGAIDGRGGPPEVLPQYEGFPCFRLPMKQRSPFEHPQVSIGQIFDLMEEIGPVDAVVAYNYPAVALARLARACRQRDIACAADITEWYGTAHIPSRLGRLIKATDTALRMRVIHKRLTALIVISTYLEDYYSSSRDLVTVRLPPLVDISDPKWNHVSAPSTDPGVNLVYAGSISAEKERVDLLVSALPATSRAHRIHLDLVGVTREQFLHHYPDAPAPDPDLVTFHGRLPHAEALKKVAQADYSVIIRDRSRVTEAGFPTKFVESITLGTPALVTPHPDLSAIVEDRSSGMVFDPDSIDATLDSLSKLAAITVDRAKFDFRNYSAEFRRLAAALGDADA